MREGVAEGEQYLSWPAAWDKWTAEVSTDMEKPRRHTHRQTHTHTHTDTHTQTDTNKYTDTQTHTQTQTHRHTDIHIDTFTESTVGRPAGLLTGPENQVRSKASRSAGNEVDRKKVIKGKGEGDENTSDNERNEEGEGE